MNMFKTKKICNFDKYDDKCTMNVTNNSEKCIKCDENECSAIQHRKLGKIPMYPCKNASHAAKNVYIKTR